VAKIILLVLGLLLVYWILRSYRRRMGSPEARAPKGGGEEDMVQCARCGVHLPRSESMTTRGLFFCSAEHQRLHQSERRTG
jgi:uncharacterized protein